MAAQSLTEFRVYQFSQSDKHGSYKHVRKRLHHSPSPPKNQSLFAVFGTFVYAFGGRDLYTDAIKGAVRGLKWSEGGTWEERTPMLARRTSEGSITFGGRFYILRIDQDTEECDLMRVLHSVERYLPASDRWQMLQPMLQPRRDPRGVVAIGGCLCIVNGINYSFDGKDCESEWFPEPVSELYAKKCDPSLDAWEALPQRLGPRPVASLLLQHFMTLCFSWVDRK